MGHLSSSIELRTQYTCPHCGKIPSQKMHKKGLTLIELLLAVAMIATLLTGAIPGISNLINNGRISRACSDISIISQKLSDYLMDYGSLPETLNEVDIPTLTDSWGNPYQYLVILGKNKSEIQGKWRKDRFLVPLNYDFDLFSMGKDGESTAPLTAETSHDDIVRANNGDYIGLASKY
jgi:general secretion pathway protein G